MKKPKYIQLLKKVLKDNYDLSNNFEIDPETRDKIETYLDHYYHIFICDCENPKSIGLYGNAYKCKCNGIFIN